MSLLVRIGTCKENLIFDWQDAEKVRQRRSRIVQILNVPQRVRLRSSLAAALLNGLFEHPARDVAVRRELPKLLGIVSEED
jgi:hypothetical protein